MKSDKELLQQFFDEARVPIPDNGFTAKVMAILPCETSRSRLYRLRLWLNITTFVASLALIIYIVHTALPHPTMDQETSPLMPSILGIASDIIVNPNAAFENLETLLVEFILFMRRLPEYLPSATQIFALCALIVTLMVSLLSQARSSLGHTGV